MRGLPNHRRLVVRASGFRAFALWMGVLAALVGCGAARSEAANGRVVYEGATLFDGLGGAPVEGSRLVVSAGRIACVGPANACPGVAGDRVVVLAGRWLTPGLIDTHVHLALEAEPEAARRDQALRLAFGITTTRDAGSLVVDAALAERARSEDASVAAPNLLVSARLTEHYAKRFGSAESEDLVAALAELGVDGIKIKDRVALPVMAADIAAARRHRLVVAGHTWTGPPPHVLTEAAIDAGIHGVVHVHGFAPLVLGPERWGVVPPKREHPKLFWQWRKGLWDQTRPEEFDPIIDRMVEAGVWLEPNLAWEFHFGRRVLPPPEMDFLREHPLGLGEIVRGDPKRAAQAHAVFPSPFEGMSAFVARFHDRGGLVVTGSDGLRPGIDMHLEIALLRRAGLSAAQALMAATRNAAIAVGRSEDRGTLEVGKRADFVVFAADPLGDPANLRRIERVVKGGVEHDPQEIFRPHRERHTARVRALWATRSAKLSVLVAVAGMAGRTLRLLIRRRRERSGTAGSWRERSSA